MTADSQHRLAARCRACGDVFWTASAGVPGDVPCPSCDQPVAIPAGRFDGIRNLVMFAIDLGPARLERLEESLTWNESRLAAHSPQPDEFVGLRRALTGLDMETSMFWRQALLTVISEVAKEPHLHSDDDSVTVVARRVVQVVMANRSYEPRPY